MVEPDCQETSLLDLRVTFDQVEGHAEFVWSKPGSKVVVAIGRVRCTGANQVTWETHQDGRLESEISTHDCRSIRAAINRWVKRFPTCRDTFTAFWITPQPCQHKPICRQEPPFSPDEEILDWIEDTIVTMARALRFRYTPMGRTMNELAGFADADFEKSERRLRRKEEKQAEAVARRAETMARLAAERRQREEQKAKVRHEFAAKKAAETKASLEKQNRGATSANEPRAPVPALSVRFDMPQLEFQETTFPVDDLRGFFLGERAALWWVSNQSDDLLCLPHCRIDRLEYQIRTALRVLGPLRGRALLSDEVGLGKTIEAGLVIKELLTRGMVRRFLVLTVPSLVDQWKEELADKFNLTATSTNDVTARDDPRKFWNENTGIVASLHTLKQPAHLEIASQVKWDILVVDEAHYLRNRESRAWQSVNALPRQFLLLLTATPVQNTLEELYNLVTLLQPGQLPSPHEFRARFLDPKRPRQPLEPEELRRLLGQVMIRNTRASAGVQLPPRRAETVIFEPDQSDQASASFSGRAAIRCPA
jgi:hypothetical protein